MAKFITFITCGNDFANLVEALRKPLPKNAERVLLYGGDMPKRYELPVETANGLDALRSGEGGRLFMAPDSEDTAKEIADYINRSVADIAFFIDSDHILPEFCFEYIESFFDSHRERCGVVFVQEAFQNLPPGGLFVFDGNEDDFPTGLTGAAMLVDDMKTAGLDAARIAMSKGMYGRINNTAAYTQSTEMAEMDEMAEPIEKQGIPGCEYKNDKLLLLFDNGDIEEFTMSARIQSISEQDKIITLKGIYEFAAPEKCRIFAHYDGEIYKQLETGESIHRTVGFELRIPYTQAGEIALCARITGVGNVPLAIGYAPESGMRNKLGNFVFGENILFSGAGKNRIHITETNGNTLKDILEKRLVKKPPHENEELLRSHLTAYAFIDKNKLLSDLA
jgi:hypothetical protein